jgi:hypothetical protein
MWRWGILLVLILCACDNRLACDEDEFRYRGRPPRSLFAYETTCRDDCFSDAACNKQCDEQVAVRPEGGVRGDPVLSKDTTLRNDRFLMLADTSSLGGNRALVFEFGFLDEAKGQAPTDWGLLQQPRSYLQNEVAETARFVMRTAVAIDVNQDGIFDLSKSSSEAEAAGSQVLEAGTGRLDILQISEDSVRGQFFLAYKNPTLQPEGAVHGCFHGFLNSASAGFLLRSFAP